MESLLPPIEMDQVLPPDFWQTSLNEYVTNSSDIDSRELTEDSSANTSALMSESEDDHGTRADQMRLDPFTSVLDSSLKALGPMPLVDIPKLGPLPLLASLDASQRAQLKRKSTPGADTNKPTKNRRRGTEQEICDRHERRYEGICQI